MYRVTQFEVPATTPIKSISFYNQVFGWTFQPTKTNKWTAKIDSNKHSIFGNPFRKKTCTTQSLTNAIEVKNVDATLSRIQKEGGQVIVPKFAVPGIGWMSYFKDLEQNVFGIVQSDRLAS